MEAVDSTGTPKARTSTRRVQTFCDLAIVMAAVVQTVVHGAGSFAGLVVVQAGRRRRASGQPGNSHLTRGGAAIGLPCAEEWPCVLR